MYNPLTLQIAQMRQGDLLGEVRKDPGIKIDGPESRLFVRLGDLLIGAGLKLHKRYKPAMCADY
ncbi:MAG: hypothetical protein JXA78_12830 [Anaerolineales bacterium]|nr:hypothetical protein [Anaerolineales bacterium]